jgi:putative hydrolase of HD superfamily
MLLKLFDAAFLQRWNDKVRPMELTELDKQAHKMVIAYFLAKFEEHRPEFNWLEIIEGGIFELLQRIVLTDLKPPIYYKIKADKEKYRKLNEWVFHELQPVFEPLDPGFGQRFRNYFLDPSENLNKRILSAAHFCATRWEFNIIEKFNPNGYEMDAIREDLLNKQAKYSDLAGIQQLENVERNPYHKFIDLCGQLRFQKRWSNLHRIPQTSVMGHMLFVAVLSYLFSITIGSCRKRCVNNYLTGLFHDLPEVLTRDIISPIKKAVEGLGDLIKEYESELMAKDVYSLIPEAWHAEIRMFTEHEFATLVSIDGRPMPTTCETINQKYNEDRFDPRDGDLIKAADMLAAFIEAYVALRNGSSSRDLHDAQKNIKFKYQSEIRNIGGIDFAKLYYAFD